MERNTEEGKVMQEREWLDHALSESRQWAACRWTSRAYVYEGKKFVLLEILDNGEPLVVDLVRISGVTVSWSKGVELYITSARGFPTFRATTHPREIAGGVYVWLPAFGDVRHAPMDYTNADSTRRMTLPICIKKKEQEMIPGSRHMIPLKEFQKTWPGIL